MRNTVNYFNCTVFPMYFPPVKVELISDFLIAHTYILFSAVPPVIAASPAVINVMDGQQLTLPCVLLAGNPLPERQWLHNYGLVK